MKLLLIGLATVSVSGCASVASTEQQPQAAAITPLQQEHIEGDLINWLERICHDYEPGLDRDAALRKLEEERGLIARCPDAESRKQEWSEYVCKMPDVTARAQAAKDGIEHHGWHAHCTSPPG
jgi:uncharacterized protein YceK